MCYNLVFSKSTIKENIGSILSNVYFIGYLISFGIFCYTKASYLIKEINKLLIDENNDKISIDLNKDNISIFDKNKEKNENNEKINVENTDRNNIDNN